jgi:hypothetical protein
LQTEYSTLQSSAAIAGSTALVLGIDASGNQALFTSYNQGAFYPNTAPGDVYFNSGYGTVIGSDGASTFYCAIADGNGNLDLWSSPNKPLNWTQLGQYSLTYSANLTSISVGKKGNTIVVAVASQGLGQQGVLVYSTDNGATFTQNTADSGIASVAFGNGIFLGSKHWTLVLTRRRGVDECLRHYSRTAHLLSQGKTLFLFDGRGLQRWKILARVFPRWRPVRIPFV